jgi:hypothetical protein
MSRKATVIFAATPLYEKVGAVRADSFRRAYKLRAAENITAIIGITL